MKKLHVFLTAVLFLGSAVFAQEAAAVVAQPSEQQPAVAEAAETAEATPQAAPAQKKWHTMVGIGFSVPFSRYKINNRHFDVVGYGLEVNYIGMTRTGFTVAINVIESGASSNDVKFEGSDDDWQSGNYSLLNFGFGYTFGVDQPISLSVLANIGYEKAKFESDGKDFDHKELGKVNKYYSQSVGGYVGGIEALAFKKLSDHAGVYASLGARWIVSSESSSAVHYEQDDFTRSESYSDEDSGNFSIVPAIGLMLGF